MKDDKIQIAFKVKKAILEYFEANPEVAKVRAKEMMDFFIEKGIFPKDEKDGLPIRSLLNELNKKNLMQLVPQAYFEMREKVVVWFFSRTGVAASNR
jgi:hypothetical protein